MQPEGPKTASSLEAAIHSASAVLLGASALAVTTVTALAAAGVIPWLSVPGVLGAKPVDAGPIMQFGAALLLLLMMALLPASRRVLRLETSHRRFQVDMEDVARAYWSAHAADRAGVFRMRHEFDRVRERYRFLKAHPDLGALDPDLLELAAQMSTEAQELARIYSDDKVARAWEMLTARHAEAERLNAEIERAHAIAREIRHAVENVDLEEETVRARIARLKGELGDLLDGIDGFAGAPPPLPNLRVAASD